MKKLSGKKILSFTSGYHLNKIIKVLKWSDIYTKYKDVRNKKLAHSTNVNFTENVGCRKEKGNIFREIKHKDLYHFDELEKDIKQIGNIVQKYANLLDVKMASIDEQLKKNHVDLPKITSEYIKEKSLFSPLL